MIHSLFILNSVGGIIIEKHFRKNIDRNIIDYFLDEVHQANDVNDVPPVIVTTKYIFVHRFESGLFFLAVLLNDLPPLYVIEFFK